MELTHFVMAGLDFPTLPEQLVNGLLIGSIYALIALGYTMVYGVLRLINFAHGEVYMLGAYVSLFVSYMLGFTPDAAVGGGVKPAIGPSALMLVGGLLLGLGVVLLVAGYLAKHRPWLRAMGGLSGVFGGLFLLMGKFMPAAFNLVLMLFASMTICAIVGVLIERFAYKPMRQHSRIASLITAIGISLFLQYGGALFLPTSPPPSIAESVNPFRDSYRIPLAPVDGKLVAAMNEAKPAYDKAKATFDDYLARTHESDFTLSPEGQKLKDDLSAKEKTYNDAEGKADSGPSIHLQQSRLIMFIAAIALMLALRHLVLFTPAGRAMRAVSHDFDSAALMGINVDRIIVFTFVLGSSLAGAGAMMTATFQGTPLTTFYGVLPGVKAFVAAVLGGIGNVPGAVLGGVLMGVVENLVVWAGYSNYKDAIAFVVLIVVLLFKPGGLLGSAKVEKV